MRAAYKQRCEESCSTASSTVPGGTEGPKTTESLALYSDYTEQIAQLRPRYEDLFSSLTSQHGDSVAPFELEHLCGRGRFLGEYYGVWVADALEIADAFVIEEITIGAVLGRVSAILDDHIQDSPSLSVQARAALRSMSQAFRRECYKRLAAITGNSASFLGHIKRLQRLESTTWVSEHRHHVKRLDTYSTHDMRCLGLKTSICFLPLVAACEAASRPDAIKELSRFIAYRNVAVQIRDDLSDWEFDLASQHFTLPLWLCAQAARSTSGRAWTEAWVIRTLYQSNVVNSLLGLADAYLELAGHSLSHYRRSPLERYRQHLLAMNAAFRSELASIYETWPPVTRDSGFRVRGTSWPYLVRSVRSKEDLGQPVDRSCGERFDRFLRSLHPGSERS